MLERNILIDTAYTEDTFNGKAQAVIQVNGKVIYATPFEFRAQADVYLMSLGYKYDRGGFGASTTYYYK